MKGREGTKNNFNSENSVGGLVHKLVHTPAFQGLVHNWFTSGSQLVHSWFTSWFTTGSQTGSQDLSAQRHKVKNYEEQNHKAKNKLAKLGDAIAISKSETMNHGLTH